ncbi:MAG TPA: 2-oxoacid:acceptor oxidoreductase subunit alpha [Planctomycetota bacterium]|nr:2-oxoacid:acceptor oxidoreductase subunit alpha [Planctomycetota bacterium]
MTTKQLEHLDRVVIRFAGDSGDGMQITGQQFTNTAALLGNDLATFPDYPAEIRAPAGTLPGVSGFQVHFASDDIYTPGDAPDVLVAMNPAALKVNLKDLPKSGILILDTDEFSKRNLKMAGYETNPIEDGSLAGYRLFAVPLTSRTETALASFENLTVKEKRRCKNFYALGMTYWLFSRSMDATIEGLKERFKKKPQYAEANTVAMKAGYAYCDASEEFQVRYEVPPAPTKPGTYRNISGNEALAIGLVAAAGRAGVPLFYGSYPITPASDILQYLAGYKNFDVTTFQAEDEIAAVGSAIGASFGGAIGVTGSSGPGIALKGEAIGLAVMVELPLVIVNVQRAGPSTGMPTKTEQADLLQAVCGRNGESPLVVLASSTPSNCFHMAFEAVRIATKYMVPVILLSDGYLANGAEPWLLPEHIEELADVRISFHTDPKDFKPYRRDAATLARAWVKPGTPGLEHRIGGLEKQDQTGNVSYDAANHQKMVQLRQEKVQRVVADVPDLKVYGPDRGKLLVIGWGSTFGAIHSAVRLAQADGLKVAQAHLHHLNPFPANLAELLGRYDRVLCPEMNTGQLRMLLRARYLVDVQGLNKIEGQPFRVREVLTRIQEMA